MATFTHITETATAPARTWTNRQLVQFHYFNPNGAVAAKRALNKRIADAVEAGKVKSGWHFAYGSLNTYHEDAIYTESRKQRVKPFQATYHANQLFKLIAEATAKLEEVGA